MEDKFLKVAKKAALEAGKVISKYFGKQHRLYIKEQDISNFATQADLEAQKTIIEMLTSSFPGFNIISEEKQRTAKNSEYTWVIDPIDGTFSFAQGLPYFSILIGLLKDNKPILGIVYHVPNGDIYQAEQGKGAYLNGKKIHVSNKNNLDSAAISFDFGHKMRRQQQFDLFVVPLMNKAGYVYGMGSGGIALAQVAKGLLEGHIDQGGLWDFVAGAVIVREAGGKVTDFEGNEPDWSKERLEIVASNGLIHDQILEALKT